MPPVRDPDHRRNAIHDPDQPDHDHHADSAERIDDFDYFHGHEYDEPADVTVSDLLDAILAKPFDLEHFGNLAPRAAGDVYASFAQIHVALDHWRRLTPEERAEFDRRTT